MALFGVFLDFSCSLTRMAGALAFQRSRTVSPDGGATPKYACFEAFPYGPALTTSLQLYASKVPPAARLKIFVSGHGKPGCEYLESDNRERVHLTTLALWLAPLLRRRALSPNDCWLNQVSMLVCDSGSSKTGDLREAMRGKLHDALRSRRFFVALTAVNTIAYLDRETFSRAGQARVARLLGSSVYSMAPDDLPAYQWEAIKPRPREPYSKVRWSYDAEGRPVTELRTYRDTPDSYLPTSHLLARRILWADAALLEICQRLDQGGYVKAVLGRQFAYVLETCMQDYTDASDPAVLYEALKKVPSKPTWLTRIYSNYPAA